MSRTIEKRRSKISSFLVTLRQMLNNQPPQYITWSSQQNSFIIKNPSRFSQEVLPKYFKHSNLSSFIRQLNIYDFKKVSNQKYPDEYIYSHPCFDKNRPQLMKNIYRKVHHLSGKILKSHHDQIPSSQPSYENSKINDRKKLKQQIQQLEEKLNQLQSVNTFICQQNLMLERKIPIIKNNHIESSKYFYKILMQSYEVQYQKFAQKIQHQLIQQTSLFNELYQRQKNCDSNSSRLTNKDSKNQIDMKSQFDTTNYNSTSSGGSQNDHSRRPREPHMNGANQKSTKKSDKKYQFLLHDQNNAKMTNIKKFNQQLKNSRNSQNLRGQDKKYLNGKYEYNKQEMNENMIDQLEKRRKEYNCSEQQSMQCASRCIIDLKNRKMQEQKDEQKMFKTIVLAGNNYHQKIPTFNPILYST